MDGLASNVRRRHHPPIGHIGHLNDLGDTDDMGVVSSPGLQSVSNAIFPAPDVFDLAGTVLSMSGYSRNLLSYRAQAIRALPWSLGLFLTVHGIVGLVFLPLLTGPPLTLAPGQTVAMLPIWAQEELQAAPWFPRTLTFGVLFLLATGIHAWARGRKPLLVATDLCNGMIVAAIFGVIVAVAEFVCEVQAWNYGARSALPPSLLQWLKMAPPFPSFSMIFTPGFYLLLLGVVAVVIRVVLVLTMRRKLDSATEGCEQCGYLRVPPSSRCPECGADPVDAA